MPLLRGILFRMKEFSQRYLQYLKDDLKDINSDAEIARLKKEIEHLKTRVEIESIRAEIYNLKMLAAKVK